MEGTTTQDFEYDPRTRRMSEEEAAHRDDFQPKTPAQAAAIERVRKLSKLLDSQFRLPGTNFSFGIDPLLGLVPVAGDVISLAFSLYIIYEARNAGLGKGRLTMMTLNVVLDALVGSVPVLGQAADFFYKANQQNLRMMGIVPDENNRPSWARPGSRRK